MPDIVKEYGVPIIIMHMRGDPTSMQSNPTYRDVVREVCSELADRVKFLKNEGIEDDKIIIDPGIGFGKRFRDNLELIGAVASLRTLGYPVLIGASRKRFLGELLDQPADQRMSGNLAVVAHCHNSDVDMVRVHDVKETVDVLRVLDAIENPAQYSADW
jgi:dihydropteroate synthase